MIGVNALGNYILIEGHFGAPALGLNGSAIASGITALAFVATYAIAIQTRMAYNPEQKGVFTFVPGVMTLILMTYFGRMVASQENFAYALDFFKPDDPAGANRYYFRTNPLFETGDARYAWLNHVVTVGKGRTGDGGVIYDIFVVK